MALPPALLKFVEHHGCFSGCYGCDSNVQAFVAATQPPENMVVVRCLDCLTHVGVLASQLPPKVDTYALADQLTQHLRTQRGHTLSVSGYHANGPGFWFSAVYWQNCHLLLMTGERSRNLGSDLDLLMLAIQHNVLKPPDPGMARADRYTVQPIFVDPQQPLPVIRNKQDLLQAPGVRLQAVKGWHQLTLAEYQHAPRPASAAASPAAAKPAAKKIGDRCPVCGAEYRVRSLLHGTFVGCLC